MRFRGLTVGWALTGSHHTVPQVFPVMERLRAEGAEIIPILSQTLATTSTRHGDPETWYRRIVEATGHPPLTTIPEVEPFGPNRTLDVLAVVPCTGNTLAKLANAVNDTAVTMAVKAQLRNGRPVVLGITTNDALGLNAVNLGRLLNARNVYFVPFGQDDPFAKPNSLVAHLDLLPETLEEALAGRQLQPILRAWPAGER
ncbi:MAG: dipicolinate synthase subunit B [Firmicutes bacterium]|nr:dipicolinate synthase subunit B [Bacillota bacterium]